jgi:hypothetical protein
VQRPDIRPQLRELLDWYEDTLARIEAGAIVAPGEEKKLRADASEVASLLARLDADEASSESA